MDFLEIGAKLGLYFVPFLFSLSFHEFAHGWMARKMGDRTAEMMGRLTLNPMAHADLVGTLILPAAAIIWGTPFFGWANPVPVNERNLRHPRKDMFWVAFAGPLSNVLLALICTVILALVGSQLNGLEIQKTLIEFMKVFIQINLSLALFNMIPIHPLDGGKVVARFLPESINRKLEEQQPFLSMLLLFLFISGALNFLGHIIFFFYKLLMSLAVTIGGML